MTELFRNSSPGALTMAQAIEREKKRVAELRRRKRQAQALAAQGRGGDTEIAHVTLGEIVLPDALQTPAVLDAIRQAALDANIPLEQLRVGSVFNSINPQTGQPEFFEPSPEFARDFPGVNERLQSYDFTHVPGADARGVTPEMESFMSRTTDFARAGKEYAVFGPDDPETLKRARVIFGETGGVYPALRNPNGKVFDESNWIPGSAEELARARAHIGAVSARNPVTHSAEPDLSQYFDRYQWNKALEAARASRALDNTLPPNVDGFFMRQDGTNQYVPNYDKLFDIGPFYTVGGHKDVQPGNRMYVDFHPKLYHPRKNERR